LAGLLYLWTVLAVHVFGYGILCTILTIRFLEVGPARRTVLLEGPAKQKADKRRVKKEYREHGAYKYMLIYLCTIVTIGFLKVSPVRRTAGKEGVQGKIKN